MGGCYPNKMIRYRDFKIIGGQVTTALEGINEDREEKHQSVVTGDPAGRKNQNDLPEIKWRHVMIMVHNWLTSNYLPWKFWYFSPKMAVQVYNYMPILFENDQWTTQQKQNMAPNPTSATLCLCSPSVKSVETRTATNNRTLMIVNRSWVSTLTTIPKVMDCCSTS